LHLLQDLLERVVLKVKSQNGSADEQ
jgi:hypothetical protein